jgi:hypothetical protein
MTGELSEQARKAAESQLFAGKTRAAEGLGSVADALRKTGEQLRSEEKTALTGYIDQAAHQVDVAAGYLKSRSLNDVIGDVESFARREPALFLGAAFVAGLVGGRFLKSSRPQAAYDGASYNRQRAGRGSHVQSSLRQGQSYSQAPGQAPNETPSYGPSQGQSPQGQGQTRNHGQPGQGQSQQNQNSSQNSNQSQGQRSQQPSGGQEPFTQNNQAQRSQQAAGGGGTSQDNNRTRDPSAPKTKTTGAS